MRSGFGRYGFSLRLLRPHQAVLRGSFTGHPMTDGDPEVQPMPEWLRLKLLELRRDLIKDWVRRGLMSEEDGWRHWHDKSR